MQNENGWHKIKSQLIEGWSKFSHYYDDQMVTENADLALEKEETLCKVLQLRKDYANDKESLNPNQGRRTFFRSLALLPDPDEEEEENADPLTEIAPPPTPPPSIDDLERELDDELSAYFRQEFPNDVARNDYAHWDWEEQDEYSDGYDRYQDTHYTSTPDGFTPYHTPCIRKDIPLGRFTSSATTPSTAYAASSPSGVLFLERKKK